MKFLMGLSFVLAMAPCFAKDYGVQGTTWPILEVDFRKLLVESAARADFSAAKADVKKSAETFLERLPKRTFPIIEKTSTLYVDPSIILTSDIQAPIEDSTGTYKWSVLFPKGTKVNPLEKLRPTTAFLLFDGSDEEQVKLVEATLTLEPNRIIPVEAGRGDLEVSNKRLKRPTFYASDAMINRFQVKNLPSLVYPGSGQYQFYLGVTSYSLPFNPNEVIASWDDLKPKSIMFKKP